MVSPPNDVWETSTEIPYWWRAMTQIWRVFLIGWIKFPMRDNQSETLPRTGYWCVTCMAFLRLFLRCHLAGKPVIASQNVCRPWNLKKEPIMMSERGKTQRFFHGTTPDHLKVNHASIPSRIYCLGEKSRVAKGHELPSGVRGHAHPPPWKFFEMNMGCDAVWCILRQFWEMLRWYFIFFFSHNHVPCHVVSLDREHLLHVHWPRHIWMIFPIQLLIYYNDNNIFGGKAGHSGGICSTPQIP